MSTELHAGAQNFTAPYDDGLAHVTDELAKLDLIIKQRVYTFREELKTSKHSGVNQHVFISHEEVDWLLECDGLEVPENAQLSAIDEQIVLLDEQIAAAVGASVDKGIVLPLIQLARLFNLSTFELQALIICLAPELRRKYDRLYAYLQDDISRKKSSVDLVLDLLCRSDLERWQAQSLFTRSGVLLRTGLLQLTDDPQSPSGSSGLARFLSVDPRIVNFVLGHNVIDARLEGIVTLHVPERNFDEVAVEETTKQCVFGLVQRRFAAGFENKANLLVHLHGPYGVGKKELALGACGAMNCLLLRVDLEQLGYSTSAPEESLRFAFREALLLQAPLYLEPIDVWLNDELKGLSPIKTLADLIDQYGWLTFVAGAKPWHPRGLFEHTVFKSVALPLPDVPLREKVWRRSLGACMPGVADKTIAQLARQFRLTPGQSRDAISAVSNDYDSMDSATDNRLDHLLRACRQQSNQKLRELAVKIEPHYTWDDIVLPEEKTVLLQEICNQVRQQYKVFSLWGFDQKLAYGRGLSALFSGPPGTGKTLAAQVIAYDLSLDLYKIDLSSVVSKYIGETEKNLSRIFEEAETSNSVLFFDEADALFGKRTEVSDAHDRYANIEVSYLLQKMEEYNGIVILASNFRSNMDEAFVRRIRFIVEFPFPDETGRLQIWKCHFPAQAPVAQGINYPWLAKQFAIPGGNIKNIALNAAFLAAQSDRPIDMSHLIHSAKREYEKIGKLWNEGDIARLQTQRR